ncbi:MAG: hypothetical protein HKN82_08845 [Akkermansiaceae bacterium]|nr:hypothetical protein [Akkermansiaceae bacterium]NNM27928.1 hypothetical protein [Akkermansiaceae bacterium]
MKADSRGGDNAILPPPRPFSVAIPAASRYHPASAAMTRKSIETASKLFIWLIFAAFLFVAVKVLGMMGIF